MAKLPQVRPKDVLKAVRKVGFKETNRRGSHIDLHHPDCRRTSIAIHPKPLFKGTLHKILKQTELTIDELKRLMK